MAAANKNTAASAKSEAEEKKTVPSQATSTETVEQENGKLALIIGDKVPAVSRAKNFVKANKKTILGIAGVLLTGVVATVIKARMDDGVSEDETTEDFESESA